MDKLAKKGQLSTKKVIKVTPRGGRGGGVGGVGGSGGLYGSMFKR